MLRPWQIPEFSSEASIYLDNILTPTGDKDIDKIIIDNTKKLIDADLKVFKGYTILSWKTAFKKQDGIDELNKF